MTTWTTDPVERARLEAELQSANAERDAALTRIQQLSAELRNLQAERVAVVADYRRVHALNESLHNEIAALKSRMASDRERAVKQQAAVEAELTVVTQSRSWRLTAPLRGLIRVMSRAAMRKPPKTHA